MVKFVHKTVLKSFQWAPTVHQNLSTCHDWHVKRAVVDLPISLKGNSKCTSDNS